ncbi:MAG: enolase C-terminal domain-like protein [Microbacterium sp.]
MTPSTNAVVRSSYRPDAHVPPEPWRGEQDGPTITDVRCVITAPEGVNLVVVIVETSEPGLIGYGCATFTQRAFVVRTAIEEHVRPLVLGRAVADVADIHRAVFVESYWRGDVTLNSALSGLDEALWDIKGKVANLPVWQLLGGRVRESVPCYVHASGTTPEELLDQARRQVENGYTHVRCQVNVPGTLSYGAAPESREARWDPDAYVSYVPDVLERMREELGDGVRVLHDVHERLSPGLALEFIRRIDHLGLFFIEDPLAPEDLGWLPRLRTGTSTRIAIGELFTRMDEYTRIIAARDVDIVRCHVSALGGITPAWQLAQIADAFGVQLALHGPRDVSPVGHAANLAIEFAAPALAVREHHEFADAAHEVFPGIPLASSGGIRPSDAPGLGIGFDERAASAHPPVEPTANWHYMRARRVDGTVQRP